eukprot:1181622-Prorocentrum_minimum.AAC.3
MSREGVGRGESVDRDSSTKLTRWTCETVDVVYAKLACGVYESSKKPSTLNLNHPAHQLNSSSLRPLAPLFGACSDSAPCAF